MSSQVDVLIITALKEEYDEAREVNAGAVDSWKVERSAGGMDVAFRTYQAIEGRKIRIALTWAPRMRTTSTAVTAAPLIDQLKPQCLAMCGVCAGRRGKVHPGDVIIGSLLYTYDTGAIQAEYDEHGQRHERFKADPNPYQLNERWLHRVQGFAVPLDAPWLAERPQPLETQGNWLLAQLRAGQDPLKDPDERRLRCPAWDGTITRLRKLKLLKRHAPLTLTRAGQTYIDDKLLRHPDGLPTASTKFRVHVAPIATGNNVMRDPLLFDRLSDSMREVLGVEMEAAAIAHTAHTREMPWIVMKAAMDHADDDKDDQYKKFASRSSAECLFQFLRENLLVEGIQITRVPDLVATGHLPQTGSLLLGREEELRSLDAAWEGPARRHVITIVAFGGTGKTSLVNRWLAQRAPGYGGARRVLGWSFYSQGTSAERWDSADTFIAWALRMLGDRNPSAGSPFDKAERLTTLVRQERTLLVLDGVEPLQTPPGPDEGRLKDHAFAVFLRDLCAQNSGLCIVTSRLPLSDLAAYEGQTAQTIDLLQLGLEPGAALLRNFGVDGTEGELQQAVEEFGGHALALTLLGQYLNDACDGDIRLRGEVGPLEHEETRGGHARRVMASYERWFREGPERDLLHVLGLFDRPAGAQALVAVREAPAIPGLTVHLTGLDGIAWNKVVARLRRARLLEEANQREPRTLDAHPLVREHFGEALRTERPAAWQEGHRRLFVYFKNAAKALPDTLEEMGLLYAAMTHGCHAGTHRDALHEIFERRINRGSEFYAATRLGAISANLAALSGLFEVPWSQPVSGLAQSERAWVLSEAGLLLRGLGRLREAVEPMAAGLAASIEQKDWSSAAIAANNLGELHLSRGEVTCAIEYARKGLGLIDNSGDATTRMIILTTLADALHQSGQTDKAQSYFIEAETIHANRSPQYPLLDSLGGFRYCDLLLSVGDSSNVINRAAQDLPRAKQCSLLLIVALDHLTLGRAHLTRARAGDAQSRDLARQYLDQAVAGLRQARLQDELPRSLLASADFFLFIDDLSRARADLDEVLAIATRGSMRLHEADAHLFYTRLYLASGDRAAAQESLEKARKIITNTCYGRRMPELKELTARFETPAQEP